MTIYVALMRGINVGGKNKIKMAELRNVLSSAGMEQVQTYIQSGNILFVSDLSEVQLQQQIEQKIEASFNIASSIILRTAEELKRLKENCPFSEEQVSAAQASSTGECLYVSMMREVPSELQLEKLSGLELSHDRYERIGRDIYLLFHDSIRNSKLATKVDKLGVPSTVRNWKTISKLVSMAEEMAAAQK